ncbi:MAG: hypothetical protein HIU83_00380 [Proteobacteria bacterium]|nr:hypothetical protein [Pseudomonadota bacterium]
MKAVIIFIAVLLMMTTSGVVFSADLKSLATEGYEVIETTNVVGQFKGCDATTALTFTNGKVFVCSTYAYSFAIFMPDVYVLQNQKKEIKVLINGIAYSGSFIEQKKKPSQFP